MSSETLHAFLRHLSTAKPSGGQWLARCPAHDDRHASLAVREGDDGRVLVHCHAGCTPEAIVSALSLDVSTLFPPNGTPKAAITDLYDYRDEQGTLLSQAVRLVPKDFRQRRPDGAGGWIYNLSGVRRVCYRLPELKGRTAIFALEGEKDVDRAWSVGLPATTNAGGCGKWTQDLTAQLVAAGVRRVAIIPDNDVPGRAHAEQVAASVHSAGLEARIVVLPGVPPKGDLSVYLAAGHTAVDVLALARAATRWTPTSAAPPDPVVADTALTTFRRTDDGTGYLWARLPPGITFELGRVRRDHHELTGELTVRCDVAGTSRTPGGALLTAEFNLSSARARTERAKLLAQRAKTGDEIDWMGALEEFCERVFEAERLGAPAIRLDTTAHVEADHSAIRIEGLALLCHHPVILFGDGGSAKSYLSLYLAGRLAQQGQRVLYADWELLPDEHVDRLTRLFGSQKPPIWYVTCERPLVAEADRLLKIIRSERITYLIVDSVAVACDGPPEAAEVTTAYFRAIRSFGVGSLHLAHTNRSEQADRKPFGSSFWHNLARATWFVQRSDEDVADRMTIGLFNRKANLGPLLPPAGFTFDFDGRRTQVTPQAVEAVADLAAGLPLWHRMQTLLRTQGAMSVPSLAEELGAKPNTVIQITRRRRGVFERFQGPDKVTRVRLVTPRVTQSETVSGVV
jgi:hypothetical protein